MPRQPLFSAVSEGKAVDLCLPPFSPELGAALLSGKVDYARLLDPVSAKKVKETPGMSATDFYQSVIQAAWVNNELTNDASFANR